MADDGFLGGLFGDPTKVAALSMLAHVFDPYGKDNTQTLVELANSKTHQNAMLLALKQAGLDDNTAKALASNPAAAKMMIDQRHQQQEKAADGTFGSIFSPQPSQPSSAPAPMQQPAPAGQAQPPMQPTDPNLPRGLRNNNPLNIESGSYTQSQPGYSGSDGRFAKFASADQGTAAADNLIKIYGGKGINTVAGVIGRWAPASDGNPVSAYASSVAKDLGVGPTDQIDLNDPSTRQKLVQSMGKFENGRPIGSSSPPVMAQGDDGPQAPPPLSSSRSTGPNPQRILDWIVKNTGIASKEAINKGWAFYDKAVEEQKPTEGQKDYNAVYQQNKSMGRPTKAYEDWVLEKAHAGSSKVSIDQKGEGAFESEFGKKVADRWSGYLTQGDRAQEKMADINTLRKTSQALGSQGAAAGIKQALGPYAESLGIPIEGLNDIQLWDSVVQKMAPQMRAAGSGSTSDIEFKGMLRAVGSLSNNPEARERILDTFEAGSRNDLARAEIATKLATKEITRTDAEKQIRALPDPMTSFREWRDKNPDAYASALKGQSAPAAAKPAGNVDAQGSLANARAAIARNPAVRDAVIQRLRENGLDPGGL